MHCVALGLSCRERSQERAREVGGESEERSRLGVTRMVGSAKESDSCDMHALLDVSTRTGMGTNLDPCAVWC